MSGKEPEQQSDSQLLEAYKTGDDSAFKELIRRYHGPLLTLFSYRTGCRDTAEDLLQITFMKFFQSIHRYSPVKGASLKTWLYTIALNTLRDNRRKFRRNPAMVPFTATSETSDKADGISERVIDSEKRKHVQYCMKLLPKKYFKAVWLYYYEGMPYKDIAGILHIPIGTVKSRLYNGIKKLENLLEKSGFHD